MQNNMENKKIILLTKYVETETLLKKALSSSYEVRTTTIEKIDEDIAKTKGLFILIIDLSRDDLDYIKKYIFLHLEHELLQIVAITSKEIYLEAPSVNKITTFWVLDPENTDELIAKIEQFKKYRVSTMAKIRILETAFEKTPLGFAIIPTNHDYEVSVNTTFTNITGYTKEEYVTLGWNKITYPDDAYIDQYIQRRVEEGQEHATIRKRIVHKEGRVFWIEQSLDIVNRQPDGSYIRVVMIRDITSRTELEKTVSELNRSQEVMFNNLPGLAYRCLDDENYTMFFVSDGSTELTGYSPAELVGKPVVTYNEIVLPKYRKQLREAWDKAIREHSNVIKRYGIKTKSGEIKWVVERGVAVYDERGHVVALEGIIFDITHSKKLEDEVRFYHEYDARFRLPNRSQLTKNIQTTLEKKNPKGTIILINLKDTQKLYRAQGHEYVELLSLSLVNKLKTLQTKQMVLYYLEEDIYAFYTNEKVKHEEIMVFYNEIHEAIFKTIMREQIHCYIGVRHLTKQSLTSETCLQRARIASEFNRDEDKLMSISYFNEEMETLIKREDTIKRELIELSYSPGFGALRLVFQPILSLRSGKTIGFEALARYTSPIYGVIPPSEFIPIVERNRMIIGFGKKINELAMSFAKQLIDSGINDVKVSINVSTLQLLDTSFVTSLIKVARDYGVPHSLIVIEMTETVFSANYELLNYRLEELHHHGFRISLDDFGTGFSSLSHVAKLDFDTIKIDKSFIDELDRGTIKTSIIPEIIRICQKFDIASLAEGIETSEQYNYLRELGCDYGQGYFMSRPLEKDVALKYIKDEKEKAED